MKPTRSFLAPEHSRGTVCARMYSKSHHTADELFGACNRAKIIRGKLCLDSDKIAQHLNCVSKQLKGDPYVIHEVMPLPNMNADLLKQLGDISFVIRDPIDLMASRASVSPQTDEALVQSVVSMKQQVQSIEKALNGLKDEELADLNISVIDTTVVKENLFDDDDDITLNNGTFEANFDPISTPKHRYYDTVDDTTIKCVSGTYLLEDTRDNDPQSIKHAKLLKRDALQSSGLNLTSDQQQREQRVKRKKVMVRINDSEYAPWIEGEASAKSLPQHLAEARQSYHHIKRVAKNRGLKLHSSCPEDV